MRRSNRLLFGLIVAVVTFVWGLTGVMFLSADARSELDDPALSTAHRLSTSTTPVVTTPPTTAAVPVEAPPVSAPPKPVLEQRSRTPRTAPPLVKVGEIEIPKVGLRHVLYEGVDLSIIDHGPGHWPGAAMPGEAGNVVFAGHRVTHSRPFFDLDKVVPGDKVIFHTSAGTFTYEMTEQLVVSPKDIWIANPTPNATMTLFACHPKGSARQRIVIRGNLVAAERLAA